jgi:small conductance mechanosensitive channel
MNIDLETITGTIKEIILDYGPKLIGAIVVLIIGLWIIKLITNGFSKLLDKREVDASLKPFLKSLVGILLKVLLVITVFSMLSIEMTSFIAILGAAGLAIGMALSGTLQNFAGGVMILIFKPYKVGDFITAQGHSGSVNAIQIFNTILKTPDNKTIIIPNGQLSNSSMTNFSTEPTRRVDWVFGVAYGDSLTKTKKVLHDIVSSDERVLKDKDIFIGLTELADSSVNFTVRAWVKSSDYWGMMIDTNEKVYEIFEKEGLSIPFPQMDVHLQKAD